VLPDRSVLIGQKLVEMPKLKNSNATFWMIFKHCASKQKSKSKNNSVLFEPKILFESSK